jgi:hypothetical protein
MADYETPRGLDVSQVGDVSGYTVEASDGKVGRIDPSTFTVNPGHIVVKTGFWVFGGKHVLPDTTVQQVDFALEKVYLSWSRRQVKAAPTAMA